MLCDKKIPDRRGCSPNGSHAGLRPNQAATPGDHRWRQRNGVGHHSSLLLKGELHNFAEVIQRAVWK